MRQDCPEGAAGPDRGWLDDLPRHWSVERVSNRARMSIGWTPPTSDDSNFDGENLWANISDLGERYVGDTAKRVSDEAVRVARAHPVPAGSLLFSFKLSVGAVSFPTVPMYTNEAIAAFTPRRDLDMRYAYYAFPIYILQNAGENIYGAPILNQTRLAQAKVAFPPLDEQRAIADYLDRETAQIDAFIAKNEELTTLLTERRAAATFRLVTGLDVTEVPSKSVKADWFRVVPQTWDVAPLYTMANTFAGGTPKSDADEYWTDDDDDGVEWIAIGDMRAVQAGYPHGGRRVTTAGLEAAGLTPRSGPLVLFAMYASVGEVAMLRRPAVWNQAILGIRANPSRLNERYLYWTLLALRPKLGIYFRSNTQDNLNAAQVRGLRLPVPPLDEQLAIADQLEETWASVDEAIATAQRGVELARERRAALISAAVTGKIDVGVAV